jgi:p-hydroxybenzoate 3-monooxygenase
MKKLRTQIAIIGAGPSGLLLGQLLQRAGVDNIVIEQRSRDYVLSRIRAGVLEQTTVDLIDATGCGERMHREGLVHNGIELCFDNRRHRIDLHGLTGGKSVTIYGQTEVTRDLMDARAKSGALTLFEALDVRPSDFDSKSPRIRARHSDETIEIECEFIAGCDGYHGISRASVPQGSIQNFERVYPFGWLGVLADVRPVSDEIVYINHADGFAMCSMRSLTRSRYYVQCAADENVDEWSDDRFWATFKSRLDPEAASRLITGPSIEKSVAPLRSFVAEPMRFGQMFLVGDAAHIVPPTGAKGLNLAASDVALLSGALIDFYRTGSRDGIERYSRSALARIWKAERFSWWLTSLMHRFPDNGAFGQRIQLAELTYIVESQAASTSLAENYVGLPISQVQ